MIKFFLATCLFCCLWFVANTQGTNLKWARNFGSSGTDIGKAISVDASGNVYSIGQFSGTVDFDPGPGVFNLASVGSSDIYILKMDGSGNFIWAKKVGGLGTQIGLAITVDNVGNVYYTGMFQGIADFDPGLNTYNLTAVSTNAPAAFISKLDASGNFVWAVKFEETRFDGLVVGPNGDVYATGGFSGTVDFDPGSGTYNLTENGYNGVYDGQTDVVVLRLTSSSNFVWAKSFGGNFQDYGSRLVVDPTGNVYVMGSLDISGDLDPGPGIFNVNTNGGWDVFFVLLDSGGNFSWGKMMGGPGSDFVQGMALDAAGNVYAAGYFYGSGDYDPGPGVFTLTAPSFAGEVWVGKFTSAGSLVWARRMGGIGEDFCAGLSLDAAGNVYTTGGYMVTADFDPGAGTYNLTSNGGKDVFISRLDNNGNFVWAKTMGASADDAGFGITVDGGQNVYTTGYFAGTVDFDPEAGVCNLTSNGQNDAFIQKLSQCLNASSATLTVTACNAYTLNNQTYTTSGTYSQTLVNRYGCDSLLTLHLTIGGTTRTDTVTACDAYTWQGQTYSSSGVYTKRFSGADGCDSILKLRLTVRKSSAATIDTSICQGQSYAGYTTSGTYTNTFTAANGCDSVRTLHLTVKAKSYATINAVICEGQTYLGYTSSGTFYDTLTASNGCDSIRMLHLVVNPKKYTTLNASICEGQSYFAAGAMQTKSGIYKDTLVSMSGCDSVVTTNLTVHPNPVPNLGSDKDLCQGTTLTLSPGSFVSYQWQNGSTASSFNVVDTGTYWVAVLDGNGCRGKDTVTVRSLLPIPQSFLKQSDSLCQYDKLTLSPLQNFQTYLWSNGSTQPTITVSQPGFYTLTATDRNGCTGKDTTYIFQKQCATGLFVPTGFTPNGDGKNDLFQPRLFGNVKSYQLRVYNRWGGIVFQTNDLLKGWDGRISGVKQNSGVYVWICLYQLEGDIQHLEKGTVTLLR